MPLVPLRSISPPLTGPALAAWARDFSPRFGVDLFDEINDFSRKFRLPRALNDWSIADVTDCFAFLAKSLDERGLLDIPPEAREQMERRIERCTVRDPHRPVPGPLTLQPQDPLLDKKRQIVALTKELFKAERQRDPTETEAWDYLLSRCVDHRIFSPDSLRNLHRREHVHLILSILKEDLTEMNRL